MNHDLSSRVGGCVGLDGVGSDRQPGGEGKGRAGLLSSPGRCFCFHHEEDLQSWISQGN